MFFLRFYIYHILKGRLGEKRGGREKREGNKWENRGACGTLWRLGKGVRVCKGWRGSEEEGRE